MLVAFGAVSLWVLTLDLLQVVVNGRVWTGTDGVYIVDQMQYLAWIKSASHHLLASNMFVLRSTPHDYFQPAVVISGGLSALGLSPAVSLLLWKPVAVGGRLLLVPRVHPPHACPGSGPAGWRCCSRCSSARSRPSTGRSG